MELQKCCIMTCSCLSRRHAGASLPPGRGGLPLQPVPGGRGSEPQGRSVFRESVGHADDHDLETLPP